MCHLLSMLKPRRGTWNRDLHSTRSEQLHQSLQTSLISSAFNAASFVPNSELTRLIVQTTVFSILEEIGCSSKSHGALSATIVQAAPKLFAVLVWTNQVHLVFSLASQFLNDENLPLDDHGSKLAKIRATAGWSRDCEARILRDQWIFLSPSFHDEGQFISLQPYVPLPFIFASSVIKESAGSTIRQVQIHPSHQEFLNKENV
jgi:hypothetical protein